MKNFMKEVLMMIFVVTEEFFQTGNHSIRWE